MRTHGIRFRALFGLLLVLPSHPAQSHNQVVGPQFIISLGATAQPGPVTGRLFLALSRRNDPEVRLQSTWLNSPQFFAVDAKQMRRGQRLVVDGTTLGYPFRGLSEVPPGDYYIQAFLKVYVEYRRSDGHVLWGLDQWEGQEFDNSPGTLYSKVQRVHLNATRGYRIGLSLSEVVPDKPPPADTEWVKNIKIQSTILTKFWGRPIYLGATVLLPRDYAAHPDMTYPVIYEQKSHFLRGAPFEFNTVDTAETKAEREAREKLGVESGYEFYQAWDSDGLPRMIVARLINPTPFYDFSGAVNSANNGPFGDAIVTELIPYLEERFRIIRAPFARTLVGKSSGGRDALALQLLHPDFFGGAWIFYPWAFDYRHYFNLNIYEDKNAFLVPASEAEGYRDENEWLPLDRYLPRTVTGLPVYSMRQYALHDLVQGGESGVGAELTGSDNALNSPVGVDGLPRPLFDKLTGKIDREVAEVWRGHDLTDYTRRNWPRLGPLLVGKLHFYVGDADEWYRNYGVHDYQELLETTRNPHYAGSFVYGALKGHGWQPMSNIALVRMVAGQVLRNTPQGTSAAWADRLADELRCGRRNLCR